MRNLKKIISLVLAMMMVMSLMVTANAAFADADDIQYAEAAEVMNALGILEGVPNADGTYTFYPESILTREQAAKIVAYIAEGGELDPVVANALANPFSDVSGWAVDVIKYCAANNIINGFDGKFAPQGELDGYSFAKMLLVAMGKDGVYTGDNWKVAVATDAKDTGLLAGLAKGFSLANPLSREAASQMALNAMTWTPTGLVYTVTVGGNDILKTTDAMEAYRLQAQITGSTVTPGPAGDSLLATNFEWTMNPAAYDDFGRPGTNYADDNSAAALFYADAPVATFTKAFNYKTLYTTIGARNVANATAITLYTDGDTNTSVVSGSVTATNTAAVPGTGNGTLVEVYKDVVGTNTYWRVVIVSTNVGTITDYTEEVKAADGSVTTPESIEINGTLTFNTHDFTEADAVNGTVVLYTMENGNVASVEVAAYETLTATSRTAASFVAGGKTYAYSANVATTVSSADVTGKAAKVVYFDKYGYVIDVTATAAAPLNYAYVLDAKVDSTNIWTASVNYAKLLYTDGTVEIVKAAADYTATGTNLIGHAVSYRTNAQGLVVLTDVAAGAAGAALTTNVPSYKSNVANAKTVFVVETTDPVTSQPVYTVYTGISNVPSLSAVTTYAGKATAGAWNVLFLMGSTASVAPNTSTGMIYVDGASRSGLQTDVALGEYYTYNAIVNGEITTVDATIDSLNGFQNVVTKNSDGLITGATLTGLPTGTSVVSGTSTRAAANGVVTLNGTALVYNDDTVVYVANGNTITKTTVAKIATDSNDVVTYVKVNNVVSVIVINPVAGV